MSEKFYTLLTNIGKAKIANATALGKKLNLVNFQVGDGNGSYYNPTEDQIRLKNKVWEGKINSVSVDKNNCNQIVIEVLLPSNIGGFMIREAAILDDEDNVIAIAKYPETYKPILADGGCKDLLIRTILEVENVSNVTFKVDSTMILATKKDIDILENRITNIEDQLKTVDSQIGEITKLNTTEKTNVVGAINELFTSAGNGKTKIATAITGKGIPATNTETFDSLSNKINNIITNKANWGYSFIQLKNENCTFIDDKLCQFSVISNNKLTKIIYDEKGTVLQYIDLVNHSSIFDNNYRILFFDKYFMYYGWDINNNKDIALKIDYNGTILDSKLDFKRYSYTYAINEDYVRINSISGEDIWIIDKNGNSLFKGYALNTNANLRPIYCNFFRKDLAMSFDLTATALYIFRNNNGTWEMNTIYNSDAIDKVFFKWLATVTYK